MAHFSKLDSNNIVTEVIVVNNDTLENLEFPESETIGIQFCKELYGYDTEWKQTSYNNSFRKNYAGIDYYYDSTLDAFIPPKPYPSWILNSDTCLWYPPVPKPDGTYIWDEENQTWNKYSTEG